jgi:predicted lipid-binding transport protein (Tim44 family)
MDIIVFAIVALLLGYRLYTVLGRDDGPIPQNVSLTPKKSATEQVRARDKLDQLLRKYNVPLFLKPTFSAILLKEPTFDFRDFLEGAEGAYELILTHGLQHDLNKVQDYVDPKAQQVLSQLEKIERFRLKVNETTIVGAEFHNVTALITVQFKSFIQAKEIVLERLEDWTFSRNLESNNPTWILTEVIPLSV